MLFPLSMLLNFRRLISARDNLLFEKILINLLSILHFFLIFYVKLFLV